MKKLVPIITCVFLLASCQSRKDKIGAIIDEIVEETEFNGYLYVEHRGDVLYNDTIQSPSMTLPVPGSNTQVYLASLTKLFTEVAILKLNEKGLIDLDAPIIQYRHSFEPGFGRQVKIMDLLKMTSGLPREVENNSMPFVQFDTGHFAGPFLDTLPDFKLSFEPGTKSEYSNLNYWILGSIIEHITDRNLHDAFDHLMFNKLQMTNSGIFQKGAPIITKFSFIDNQWVADSIRYEGRYASGGGYSTIKDLKTLSRALSGDDFLEPASRKLLESAPGKIEVYGALPANSNMYIQNFTENYTLILLNNIGLKALSSMTDLKNRVEGVLGIEPPEESKNVVRLDPVRSLNDSIAIEKSLKDWVLAVESEDAEEIYRAIKAASIPGSMSKDDRVWEDLSQLNKTLPDFKALGFRWVKNQNPKGVEVWFGSAEEGKLAIRWLLSQEDTTLVENLFIMPDDMTWQGKSY